MNAPHHAAELTPPSAAQPPVGAAAPSAALGSTVVGSATLGSAPLGSAIPDTRGSNFYRADPALAALLKLSIAPDLFAHLEPHLDRLGALAGGRLDSLAGTADRNPPKLHQRDRTGADVQSIEKHPAYEEMERLAFGEYGLAAMSHRAGVFGWPAPLPPAAKYALSYLFVQAEFGLCCPVSMTDALARTLGKFGSAELGARYLPGLTATDMDVHLQGAMFMTEQGAGSDVGATATVARLSAEGAHWLLEGDKWFCSNADADVALVLARPVQAGLNAGAGTGVRAGAGTRALSLFLLPRVLPDGTPNHYRIVRLKDKLGTRSMASGEITLSGAHAYLVGDPAKGFVQMADMINMSRLSNGMRAAGLMRRAYFEARHVAENRVAFGTHVIEMPLARRQLCKILLLAEAARSVMFAAARALQIADGVVAGPDGVVAVPGGTAAANVNTVTGTASAATAGAAAARAAAQKRIRILTPLLKFRACRDARRATGDAMEMRGGTGYIEEWPDARLTRDAHLGSIWEGTSNIVAQDVLRAIRREGALDALSAELDALEHAAAAPAELRHARQRAEAFARAAAADQSGVHARQAASGLYYACAAVYLCWEGARLAAPETAKAGGSADATLSKQRAALASLIVRHKLAPRDPLEGDAAVNAAEEAAALLL